MSIQVELPAPKVRQETRRPFNLQYAKEGAPIVTRLGHKARIICYDKKNGELPLIGLITYKYETKEEEYETAWGYTSSGCFYLTAQPSDNDLFIAPYYHLFGKPVFHGDKVEVKIEGCWEERIINSDSWSGYPAGIRWPVPPHVPRPVQQYQALYKSRDGKSMMIDPHTHDSEDKCIMVSACSSFVKAIPTVVVYK